MNRFLRSIGSYSDIVVSLSELHKVAPRCNYIGLQGLSFLLQRAAPLLCCTFSRTDSCVCEKNPHAMFNNLIDFS